VTTQTNAAPYVLGLGLGRRHDVAKDKVVARVRKDGRLFAVARRQLRVRQTHRVEVFVKAEAIVVQIVVAVAVAGLLDNLKVEEKSVSKTAIY
jgi:predicted RNA methylase